MAMGEPDVGVLLDRLSALAPVRDREPVAALRSRLVQRRFRVLVVGEAKRGKSTLVNALLGRVVLPTGVTPVTALPTVVRHGQRDLLEVRFLEGRSETRPFSDLPDLVTESANPDNRLGLAEVVVRMPAGLLDGGVEVVDTPGVGSVFAHSAAAATAALDTMDAAVFVLSADPPISGSERDFLAAVRDRSVALFCVLNKVDNLTAVERGEVLDFTADVLARAVGHPVAVYPVSARQALAAQQTGDTAALDASGVARLSRDLAGYLRERREVDLAASVAGHARRIAARLLDEAVLTRRAADLSTAAAGDQVTRFEEQLAALDEYRRDAADVARASASRLLADLNDAATWETPGLVEQVRVQVAGYLDGQPVMPAGALEDRCRGYAVEQTRAVAERWRAARQAALGDGLAAVDARLAASLARQVQGVRDAARDLLGVELAMPVPADRLVPDVSVSYAFGENIGVTTQWSDAIRRHLPGRWGRHAVRAHLLDELDSLVGKQIGRIRSRFQETMRPATTALVHAIEARYTELAAGLVAALAAARDIAGSPDTAAALRDLDGRATALRELVEALGAAGQLRGDEQVAARGGGWT